MRQEKLRKWLAEADRGRRRNGNNEKTYSHAVERRVNIFLLQEKVIKETIFLSQPHTQLTPQSTGKLDDEKTTKSGC